LWSFKNRGIANEGNIRSFLFAGIGIIFWVGIFVVSHRVLVYFQKVENFGDILAFKLLSMILLVFFSLLIFSSILTSLSKLYLSKDLNLVHALPVPSEKIYFARWIESTLDSSWMVIVYTIPVFFSYGIVYKTGIFFYIVIALTLFPLCIISSALSALMVLLAVVLLPASRIRSIFVFLGLAVLIILYISFRLLKPERLVNPEAFSSVLFYFKNLSTPSSPLLPSTWAFDSLKAALAGNNSSAIFHLALSWSGAFFAIFVDIWVAKALYFKGFSKTQAALVRLFKTQSKGFNIFFSFLDGPVRAFIIKEIKTFWRDQTQWSQIFLIGALIVIYLYNFSVLPFDKSPIKTIYLQNLFSFLNMALAAFVLTAITARFAFPSVSIEGNAFWIVRSSPISIRAFLWIKFFIYLFPLLILSEILIIATNMLLNVTPFMMYLSVITLFFMTPGVVAMGVGMGGAYPDFVSENPSQSVSSFGGLIFMILSAAYIGIVTILEAGPVYMVFMAGIKGYKLTHLQWVWVIGSFLVAFLLSILAVILPMKFGEKKLVVFQR
jgi:ABC-2 type transport system permease protein